MAVNCYQEHLTIFLEDRPYREIVNGAKKLLNVNEQAINAKNPCGGWNKVFAELQDNLNLLNTNKKMHALLLMDFDYDYSARKDRFNKILDNQPCKDRVFILGIDNKESEDLKAALRQSNNEKLGEILLASCPESVASEWNNQHLRCNITEVNRMRSAGIFAWLFK